MRTTLTLDDDVAQSAKDVAAKLKRPFKEVINIAVRIGLEHVEQPFTKKPYKTHSRPMGIKNGYSLDNVQELIERIEGDSFQ